MTLGETLERFNRKERNWVIRDALGPVTLRLDRTFRERLEEALRLRCPDLKIIEDAWWATDYHIDWLIAALHAFQHGITSGEVHLDDTGLVQGHQQDIDLIVASGSTLILIEAKGVGSWNDKGLKKKIKRLGSLSPCVIGEEGYAGPVSTHFLLCSPEKPSKLDCAGWPDWMTLHGAPVWMRLGLATEADKLLVERCDASGLKNENGRHWKMREDVRANRMIELGKNASK